MSMFDKLLLDKEGDILPTIFLGIVCGYGKEELAGTYQVKHLLMEDKSNIISGVYLSSPYGGQNHGLYAIPKVNDVVIVSFVGENYTCPIIIGSLWLPSGTYYSKQVKKLDKEIQFLTEGKNSICFNDEKDKQKIEIKTPKERVMILSDEKEMMSIQDKGGKQKVLLDSKNKKVQIDSEDTIEIHCGQSKITLQKDGTVKISGKTLKIEGTNIQIKGQQVKIEGNQMTLDAKMALTVKGGSKCEISASGILQAKGAMVKIG